MTNTHNCDIYCYNEQKVQSLQKLIESKDLLTTALMFKALADENRAKIIYALCTENELCVCDISNIIGASIATTSHHLRTLYKQRLVKFRKDGKLAFYSLDDEHIKQLMLVAMEHSEHENCK
ncbi:ArsR/SmtB family transcription factor [Desulfuribacillus alkaliarsenatis]|uniref:Transcriptional regulator n=1 Tax=Desulfuribacillus alkaliarsenatis TaxID=766136 RepID=A0A1E5G1B8_9FIRM|nr:metalloregulator ArsR/SmtB family transcription factor [Desulfuribacillus alkaliarsenatis]OEF96624.1 transcriptional regulator [Desulfuribacillus alkaliarsenatis]